MPRLGLPGLPRPGKRKHAAERRANVRFTPVQEIVCYWSAAGGEFARARVCDISAGGTCLLVNRRVAVGASVEIELINGPHTCLCTRTLEVLRVFPGRGLDMVIGGRFDRALSYDELLPFIL